MSPSLDMVLVKPAGPDCDLGCGYCFYLDRASLFGPGAHRMDLEVAEALVRGVFAASEGPVTFLWQGGEPTLMGVDWFRAVVALQDRHARGRAVANALQTHGLRLDDAWGRFLAEYRFLVGLSVDGPPEVHDAYRTTRGGAPTWDRVAAASEVLHRCGVDTNLLAVVHDRSVADPDGVYGLLERLGWNHLQLVPAVDLRPDGSLAAHVASPEAYGAFLCRVFDRWWADFEEGRPTTSVRLFDALVSARAGFPAPQCTLLPTCGTYLVVEHDGAVYPCDFYVEAERRLGGVGTDDLGALLSSASQRAFGEAKAELDATCRACPWLALCHGGCPRERVDGHLHHCASMLALFEHAGERIDALAARLRAETPRHGLCPCGSGEKYKRCCAM